MRYLLLFLFFVNSATSLHAQKFVDQAILTQGGLGKLPSDAGFAIQKPGKGIRYDGTLDFSYNLFPIQLERQFLSLAINYNSKGVKVEEEASEIGLGWSHNFVGKIVRTVNGYDDFARGDANGKTIYFNSDFQFVDTVPYPLFQMSYNLKYTLPAKKVREIYINGTDEAGSQLYIPFVRLADESQTVNLNTQFPVNELLINREFEPDLYNVEVPGFSAEFIIDKRGRIFEKNNSGAKYSYSYSLVDGAYVVTWKIIAPNGVIYYFNKYEERVSTSTIGLLPPRSISNWYLTQIVMPQGDRIDYKYSARNYNSIKNYTSQNEIEVAGVPTISPIPQIDLKTWVLDSIIARNFKLSIARESRKDAAAAERITAVKLHRIQQGVAVTDSVHFYQSYFIGTSGYSNGIASDNAYNSEYLTHRLKLDSLSTNIAGSKKEDQLYKFEYNVGDGQLPAKNSFSRDLWGYFHSRSAISLLPKTMLFLPFPTNGIITMGSTDRSVGELNQVQKFALKKIIYPTNGFTEIEYENNEYNIKQTNKYNFTGYTPLEESPALNVPDFAYPLVAFGSKTKSIEFYIPPSDLTTPSIPNSTVICNLQVVAPVNNQYYSQYPNYQLTFVKIYDSTGAVVYDGDAGLRNIVYNSYDPTGKQYILNSNPHLRPGKYRMEFSFDKDWQYIQIYLTIRISWPRSAVSMVDMLSMQKGPGLRVKKIVNVPNLGAEVLTTLYRYNYYTPGKDVNSGLDKEILTTYGVLLNRPINFTQRVVRSCEFPNSPTDMRLFSGMPASISPDDIGYSRIEELSVGNGDTIRKVYNYNVIPSTTANYDGMYTGGLKYINFPVNGLLTKESSYLGNTDELVYTKTYRYLYELTNEIWGAKYCRADNVTVVPALCLNQDDVMTLFAYPVMNTGYVKKLSEEEKYYSDGKELTKMTNFLYKDYNRNFIASSAYMDSQGKTAVDSLVYVQDLKGTSPVIDTMINRNLIGTTIESIKKLNGVQISREKTTYSLWNNNTFVAPLKEERSLKGAPLEVEATYEAYDQYANPLQFRGRDGIVTSLVWGYNSSYPVAKILGISYSALSPVINSGIVMSPPNDYILRKETDRWRNSFPAAFITSNTYNPLIGITSQTGVNGKTNFYEYDGQARLRTIRDKDSNVVRQIEYKFSTNVP